MAPRYSPHSGLEKRRLLTSLLDRLWELMAAAYGHAWTSHNGLTPDGVTGDLWAAKLSGLTMEQLRRGVDAATSRMKDFPPNVGTFRGMCLGIPTFAAVSMEIKRRDGMLSPFARLLWTFVDSYAFARADYHQARLMLREAYDMASEHVMQGLPLPPEPVGLVEAPVKPERHPAKPETVEREIAHMRRVLHELEPGQCPDVEVERGVKPGEVEA